MNESELEKQLRVLHPVQPSRGLEARIAHSLTPAPATRAGIVPGEQRSWMRRALPALGWASLGAAAAIAAMLSLHASGTPSPTQKEQPGVPPATAGGIDTTREMLAAADEGILDAGAQGAARVLRYTSLERQQWKDSGGGTTLVEVPREDVVLVPVSFQ